jgi:uncharacterized protein
MKLFIDTSAFLAILNRDDHFHDSAKNEWIRLLELDATMISSNYIMVETIALLQRRFGIDAVRLFTSDVQPLIHLVWVNEKVHESALNVVKTIHQRDLSLVDCTSFEIMRNMGIEQVFTFDSHFSDQGFTIFPKP